MNSFMGKQKNQEDWSEWFHEWGGRFLLFARQQSGCLAEAEDILQEAFVDVWRRRELFAEIRPGLIFTQIRRVAIDRARKNQRRQQRESAFAVENEPQYFTASSEFPGTELHNALRQLPADQREVLVLKVWGEQTFESIGETLEISPNTAASRYRYGIEKLRTLLKGTLE
jgi:RNA polymerase sigma-70 factor (ECF subfamily)